MSCMTLASARDGVQLPRPGSWRPIGAAEAEQGVRRAAVAAAWQGSTPSLTAAATAAASAEAMVMSLCG
jgi:hypothetical protein